MKNLFYIFLAFGLLFQPAQPSTSLAQSAEPESGAVLCAPDAYPIPPDDCLPLGPSTYLTELDKLGLTSPPRLLPSFKPDPQLAYLPYSYFHLEKDLVPMLNEPGGTETGQYFLPGFVYV